MTNQTQTTINLDISKKQLEDFLCSGKNLEKYLNLKFIARQVAIPPIGIIDILAYHKDSKCWVIIELKKESLEESGFCQLYSYLNYYNITKSLIQYKDFQRTRKFAGLLIGSTLHNKLEKLTYFYDHSFIYSNDIRYTLFNFSLEDGVSFAFCSQSQQDIEDQLNNIACFNDIKREGILERGLCSKDL